MKKATILGTVQYNAYISNNKKDISEIILSYTQFASDEQDETAVIMRCHTYTSGPASDPFRRYR